jgi:CRISPR-associated protein Cas1
LEIAKIIVSNKISNQIGMIKKHRWEDENHDWKADIEQLQRLKNMLSEKQTSNEIMGIEGICSNIYFGAFGFMFHCDFEFHGRNRRPPKDPINVLISLGYTFLTKEVSSALDAESFEMYLGFLHGIRYGRKSLPLDIVEEFRQPVVDRFVIFVCNKRMMNKFDFNDDEDGIQLNEEGFKKFCQEFERWMTGLGGVNYRNQIKRQVSMLKQMILKKTPYVPYQFGTELNVQDEVN